MSTQTSFLILELLQATISMTNSISTNSVTFCFNSRITPRFLHAHRVRLFLVWLELSSVVLRLRLPPVAADPDALQPDQGPVRVLDHGAVGLVPPGPSVFSTLGATRLLPIPSAGIGEFLLSFIVYGFLKLSLNVQLNPYWGVYEKKFRHFVLDGLLSEMAKCYLINFDWKKG